MEKPAHERTEEPSPRRLLQARAAGEVAFSRDLVGAVAALAFCLAAAAGGRAWVGGLLAYLHTALAGANGPCHASAALATAVHTACTALAIPLGVLVAASVLVGLAQTRGNVAWAQARPRGSRLLGFRQRLRQGPAVAFKGWIALLVLLTVAILTVRPWVPAMVGLAGADGRRILGTIGRLAFSLGIRLALALVILGLADYLWQHWRHRRGLRMTHDELRREQRETEGDPLLKAERRRIHLEHHSR
jgi:flagellar biosynthesis protein FlhB